MWRFFYIYILVRDSHQKIDYDYRFGFNGQEKDNEVAGIGNSNTAQFWQYDTRLGRRWNLDPKPQIRISDYAVMGNNPLVNTDVLGDRYHLFGIKKKGKLTGAGVSATVYIQGKGASAARARQLNKLARKTFKTKTVDGVKVAFKINYVYDSKKLEKDLGIGENILVFAKGGVTDRGKPVDGLTIGERPSPGNDNVHRVGRKTTVSTLTSVKRQNETAMHETGHLIGLDERYDDNGDPQPGFKGNVMAVTGSELHIVQYRSIINNAKLIFKNSHSMSPLLISNPRIFLDDVHTKGKHPYSHEDMFINHGQSKK